MTYTKYLDARNKHHGLTNAFAALGLFGFLSGLLTSLATFIAH
jgi:hypothetical protein